MLCSTRILILLAFLFGPYFVKAADQGEPVYLPKKDRLTSVAFSKKMDAVAVIQGDEFVRVYQFPSMKGIGSIELSVNGGVVSFSPCGQFLLTNGDPKEDGTLRIWDLFDSPPKKVKTLSVRERIRDTLPEFAMVDFQFALDGKSVFGFHRSMYFYSWEWRKTNSPISKPPFSDFGDRKYGLQESSGYFLPDDSVIALGLKGEIEIHRFENFEYTFVKSIDAESFGNGNRVFYTSVTPDCKSFVTFNYLDETVEVHDISRPRSKRVDRLLHYRRQPDGTETMGILAVAATPDRSVIIVAWESRDKLAPGAYIDFFPRTKERAAEFGLKEGQSYLQMESDSDNRPAFSRVRFSPDGKWFAVEGWQGSAPRIWRVESLGRDLLADKNVKKK